jgi:hypothetical protein
MKTIAIFCGSVALMLVVHLVPFLRREMLRERERRNHPDTRKAGRWVL